MILLWEGHAYGYLFFSFAYYGWFTLSNGLMYYLFLSCDVVALVWIIDQCNGVCISLINNGIFFAHLPLS